MRCLLRPALRMLLMLVVLSLVATSGTASASVSIRGATPQTLTVTTTGDVASPCTSAAYSLRCAITQANSDGSGDTIQFNIPSSDPGCTPATIQGQTVNVCTIQPSSDLPQLVASNTTLNGYSQPGARQNTLPIGQGDNAILTLQLDGSTGAGGLVLSGSASNNTITGLKITYFGYGILLSSSTVTTNTISGNFVGTDGTSSLGNGTGIYIASSTKNIIGGETPASANLISGNVGQGIVVQAGQGNVVKGNYVGTDASGSAALHRHKGISVRPKLKGKGVANGIGILLFASNKNNMVGGTTAANVIAHNTYGIVSTGGTTTTITGNTINANSTGILIENGERGDSISQNTLQNNAGAGILVGNNNRDPVQAAVSKNSIYANGGLGIDLYPAGEVDCGGPSSGGPNDYTPCPVISQATLTQVSGSACIGCTVELYLATNEANNQGHGEGQTFITSVTVGATGSWIVPTRLQAGQSITATATTPASPGLQETSEFAANVVVTNAIPISLSNIQGAFFPNPHNSGAFDVTPSTPAVFTQTFPVLNFNPIPQVQNCSNATGVNDATRPFTNVVPNADRTCSTIIAQGNGQQAGVGNLFNFEAEFTANFTVTGAGQFTFTMQVDDGWILSIGPNSHGDQPTYISGPMNNPPQSGKGPFTGYLLVGANNGAAGDYPLLLTVNIPAAGTYPIELDYSECCGGGLALFESNLFSAGTNLPNWSMFGYGPTHTHLNPTEGQINVSNVSHLRQVWNVGTGASVFPAPAVASGIVYVGTYPNKNLYAFDATTGGTRWIGTTGNSIHSSAAAVNGIVYVGSDDTNLYAFNAAGCGNSSCSPLWTGPTGGAVKSSPVVANGVVYVGSDDDKLYAFNAAGCGAGSCSPLWTGATGSIIGLSSPAVANGIVYITSNDSKLYAFSATGCGQSSCQPLWTGALGGVSGASPTVANGLVYIGALDTRFYVFNAAGCGSTSCSPLWTGSTGGAIEGASPAVANGMVYIGSSDNKLYAFNASGCGSNSCSPIWTATTGAAIISSPAVANGVVYVASDQIYGFTAIGCGNSSCPSIWTAPIGSNGVLTSSPVIVNGTVYIGSTDTTLYAFRLVGVAH